ncbi:chromate transporter [Aquitalea pelogenes]|uniref:chromate transporter n=1 Tax=Aquitalea pelogenes TaxID=1293573 RepID=UPI0035B48EBE
MAHVQQVVEDALPSRRNSTFGFGGPVDLVGYIHLDLVERHYWSSEADDYYKEGIALAQLAPESMAAQTAIYLGYAPWVPRWPGWPSCSLGSLWCCWTGQNSAKRRRIIGRPR